MSWVMVVGQKIDVSASVTMMVGARPSKELCSLNLAFHDIKATQCYVVCFADAERKQCADVNIMVCWPWKAFGSRSDN
jgi:hypothetical protein